MDARGALRTWNEGRIKRERLSAVVLKFEVTNDGVGTHAVDIVVSPLGQRD
jgi:hypothetical protein